VLRDKFNSAFGNLAQKTPRGKEPRFKVFLKWLGNCLTTPRGSRKLNERFAFLFSTKQAETALASERLPPEENRLHCLLDLGPPANQENRTPGLCVPREYSAILEIVKICELK